MHCDGRIFIVRVAILGAFKYDSEGFKYRRENSSLHVEKQKYIVIDSEN